MMKSGQDRPSEFFWIVFNKVSKHEFVIEDTNGTFKIEHGKMFSAITLYEFYVFMTFVIQENIIIFIKIMTNNLFPLDSQTLNF